MLGKIPGGPEKVRRAPSSFCRATINRQRQLSCAVLGIYRDILIDAQCRLSTVICTGSAVSPFHTTEHAHWLFPSSTLPLIRRPPLLHLSPLSLFLDLSLSFSTLIFSLSEVHVPRRCSVHLLWSPASVVATCFLLVLVFLNGLLSPSRRL